MAVVAAQVSVGHVTAVQLLAAPNVNYGQAQGGIRAPSRAVVISNPTGAAVYLGPDATVSSSTGFVLAAGQTITFGMYEDEALYGLAASGTQVVSVLESGS